MKQEENRQGDIKLRMSCLMAKKIHRQKAAEASAQRSHRQKRALGDAAFMTPRTPFVRHHQKKAKQVHNDHADYIVF